MTHFVYEKNKMISKQEEKRGLCDVQKIDENVF